jgi:ATP phosphoribosyltransferase
MSAFQADSQQLILALSKGRIFEDTLPLLEAAGITVTENPETSRKLILPTNDPNVRVLIVRATDVPTYVQHGAATSAWPARMCCWSTAAKACTSRST